MLRVCGFIRDEKNSRILFDVNLNFVIFMLKSKLITVLLLPTLFNSVSSVTLSFLRANIYTDQMSVPGNVCSRLSTEVYLCRCKCIFCRHSLNVCFWKLS